MPQSDLIFSGEWPSAKEPFFGVGLLRDPKFANVATLFQPNNNGAIIKQFTGIPDAKTVVANGGASVSPTKKAFGTSALWLVRNRRQYLSVTPINDFKTGTDDMTHACRVSPTSVGFEQTIFSSGNGANCVTLRINASNKFEFEIKSVTTMTGTTTVTANPDTFYTVSISRKNHVFRLMVNGRIEATYTASSSLSISASVFYIGARRHLTLDDQDAFFDGFIDAFQSLSGTALFYQETVSPTATVQGFSVSGNQLVDAAGNNIRLTGLNVGGTEHEDLVMIGLWARPWRDMFNQMKQLGFNFIRWPICDDMIVSTKTTYTSVNFSMNPDVAGKTPLQNFKMMMDYVTKTLGMYVMIDHHRCTAGGTPSGGESGSMRTGLWYDSRYSENDVINNWVLLANLFADNEFVIGADLHNEPNGDTRWGTTSNAARDWRAASIRMANAIHAVNPNWLAVVEGTEWSNVYVGDTTNYDWWGGNFRDARDPSRRFTINLQNKAVYSIHTYGTSVATPGWFNEAGYPTNLKDHYDESWGWLIRQKVSPIIVGEMGGQFTTTKDQQYIDTLMRYMNGDMNLNGGTVYLPGEQGMSYAMWNWSPTSTDTGGLVSANDWTTVDQNKMKYYNRALFQGTIVPKVTGGTGGPAVPTEAPSNIPGTILLLNFDVGVNDNVDLIRGVPVVKVGSPSVVPYPNRTGGAAFLMSQGNYFQLPGSARFNLTDQDFVLEWRGIFSAAGTDILASQADDTNADNQFLFFKNASEKLCFSYWTAAGSKVDLVGTTSLTLGTEVHLLVVRAGGTLSAYINDAREFTASISTALQTSTKPLSLGHYDGTTLTNSDLNGRMLGFRLTVNDNRGLTGATLTKRDKVFPMRG